MPGYIDFVFDGPPRPEGARLMKVEDQSGKTTEIGHCIQRGDGLWALRIGLWALQTGSSSTELNRYAAHASVLTQAIAFLTQITQTVVLYVTITGGAWAVVSSNTIGAGSATLMWILVLHIAVSFGTALGLWGLGNN